MKIIRTASYSERPSWDFAHPDSDGFLKLPVVYIRFGDLPEHQMPSMNHLRGRREHGVSVYPAYFDPKTQKYILASGNDVYLMTQSDMTERPAYLVEGKQIDEGFDDNEPVLDPKTVRIIKEIDKEQIVCEEDPAIPLKYPHDGFDGDDIPQYRQEDALAFPGNKPILTKEQRMEVKHRQDMERDERHQQELQKHQEMKDMWRKFIAQFPEHAEAAYRMFPELRQESQPAHTPQQ